MRNRGIIVASVLLSLTIASISANIPPLEWTYDAGFDSQRQRWSFVGRMSKTILVKGPRAFAVAGTEALSYMSLRGAIDRQNRLWIVDEHGEGVEIDLAAGAGRRFKMPVKYLQRGLELHDGSLYFVENVVVPGLGKAVRHGVALTRYEPVSGHKTQLRVTVNQDRFAPRFTVAGGRAWFVDGVADPKSGHACEVVGIDLGTGAAVVTDRRNAHADHVHFDDVAGVPDGSVWLAGSKGKSVRVYRRDPSGTWRDWSFDAQAPASIVGRYLTFSSGHALLLLYQFLPGPPLVYPPDGPMGGPILVKLAAIHAETGHVRRVTLPASWPTLRLDQAGGAWVGDARLLVTAERLELADTKSEKR